jgi:hypothetical protein
MVDVTVKILEPADDFKLMSLEEAKAALGVVSTDTTQDETLTFLLEVNSSTISALCNRVFAREKVEETWLDEDEPGWALTNRRLYLTHWPVLEDDIESVTANGVDNLDWKLDEGAGKLSIFTGRSAPVVVTYTGGYDLPYEAPFALKQCCSLMVATSKGQQQAAQLTGVRMISHKESRVMFHSPNAGGSSSGGSSGGTNAQQQAVQAILNRFARQWI